MSGEPGRTWTAAVLEQTYRDDRHTTNAGLPDPLCRSRRSGLARKNVAFSRRPELKSGGPKTNATVRGVTIRVEPTSVVLLSKA